MTINQSILEKGYIDQPVSPTINLAREITQLKKEKNAIILGHYYINAELQEVSDFVGDSLALAQYAKATDADIIVFLGVHFMAETAKILNPTKKVIIPDLFAGCSLADSAPADIFKEFVDSHPDHKVISYINCSADIKALSDVICTSSNAVKIVESFPKDQPLIFAPDRNLGSYINQKTGREMLLWDGACMVHEQYSVERIIEAMNDNPNAEFIAHPECEQPVLMLAHFIGSTKAMLDYTQRVETTQFIVATENGILHEMKKQSPNKTFIPAPMKAGCQCEDCSFMKLNTLKKLYLTLLHEKPELTMDEELRLKALKPMEKMLALS